MKKLIFTFILLTLLIFPCFCVNQMNQIMILQQGQYWDDFGAGLAALDFNGDGYDDLVVLHRGWVPDSLVSSLPNIFQFGRLLFYYGGPGFDSVADFTIEGTYSGHLNSGQYGTYLADLGDVNGDGYEDLGVRGYSEIGRPYIAIYFGGQNPSTQPGYHKHSPSQY